MQAEKEGLQCMCAEGRMRERGAANVAWVYDIICNWGKTAGGGTMVGRSAAQQTGRHPQLAQLQLLLALAATVALAATEGVQHGWHGTAPSLLLLLLLLLLGLLLLGRGLRLCLAAPHQAAPELISEAH